MNRTIRLAFALAAVATAIGSYGCGSGASSEPPKPLRQRRSAIVGGIPDQGDFGVVALMHGGEVTCTGTLVSERVVMTAAHCLADAAPTVLFGTSKSDPLAEVAVVDARAHAEFDVVTLDNDIAMLLLAQAAPQEAIAWPLPVQPLDVADVGQMVRLVGFGSTSGPGGDTGSKFEGTANIASVGASTFGIEPGPSHTCVGDSGGPAFLYQGNEEVLAGITSYGDSTCSGGGTQQRVDVAAGEFVKPYLDGTAIGAAGPGQRCFYAENCATGECSMPSGEPAFSYCSGECISDSDCPDGMQCVAGEGGASGCHHPAPAPGAMGAPCDTAYDCVSGVCARWEPNGERVCSVRCFPENQTPCTGGLECLQNADNEYRYACFLIPEPSSEPATVVEPMPEAGPGSGEGENAARPLGGASGCAANGRARPDRTAGLLAVMGLYAAARIRRRYLQPGPQCAASCPTTRRETSC